HGERYANRAVVVTVEAYTSAGGQIRDPGEGVVRPGRGRTNLEGMLLHRAGRGDQAAEGVVRVAVLRCHVTGCPHHVAAGGKVVEVRDSRRKLISRRDGQCARIFGVKTPV